MNATKNFSPVLKEEPEEEETLSYAVDAESAGLRADRFLSAMNPEESRTYIQKLIKDGNASIDGRTIKANRILKEGEEVVFFLPLPQELSIEPENIPLEILYEDDDLLVVNKPKEMVVHPAPGHTKGTLVNALLYHCRGSLSGINGVLRPGIVHRIDKDTTGALLVCKTDTAHRVLAERLAVHDITRRYRAIVIGNIKEDRMTIEGNIGRDPKDRKKMAIVPEGKGKPAVTHVRVLERLKGFTYIECTLETGRTHQIRVHMASVGHPVLGDPLYGPRKSPVSGLIGQTLHAMVLGFVHPISGEYMEFSAPLPEYFSKLLEKYKLS
ncbi:MAG: RluA family pseudouridine synthase [Eubacterium sp.]|nr:RluA family pseudouridine synthase [Eubacterium sp.]